VKDGYFGSTERTWSYKCSELNFSCRLTMPQWEDDGSSPELTEYWENFYNALILHEQGHVDITHREFTKAKRLAKNKSCKQAEKIYKHTEKLIDRLQKEHDRKTNHGITQGAVFSGSDTNLFQSISFSPSTGSYGFAKNYQNRQEAESAANSYCGQEDCLIVAWAQNACVSIATSPSNAYGGSWDTKPKQAEKKAKALCQKYDSDCKVMKTICND